MKCLLFLLPTSQVEQDEAATYAPQINPISAAIAAAVYSEKASAVPLECGGRLGVTVGGTASSAGPPGVVDRLSAEASLAIERRAQRELQRREAEAQECPFKPQVNLLSDRIVTETASSLEIDGQPSGVFARLQHKAEEAAARRKERELQVDALRLALSFALSLAFSLSLALTLARLRALTPRLRLPPHLLGRQATHRRE